MDHDQNYCQIGKKKLYAMLSLTFRNKQKQYKLEAHITHTQ